MVKKKAKKKTKQALEKEMPLHSKDKLLNAAFEIFARKGFHGATTKMIAREAGVNEALISRHFQTKAGLFISVIEQRVIPIPKVLPYAAHDNLADELASYADCLFTHNIQYARIMRILFGQALLDDEFANYARARLDAPHSSELHDRLLQLQKEKKLNAKADLGAIQSAARDSSFTSFLFSVLLGKIEEKQARKDLRHLLKTFAKGVTI